MGRYDCLVVGAGLYGATFAYLARRAGKKVLVIDKRDVPGGNVACTTVAGINVHTYGPHIFHTNNKEVWDFVGQFASFNRYTNAPMANYKGRLFNLPFNMNTFYNLWGVRSPQEAMDRIREERMRFGIREPRNLEEQAISLVGSELYRLLVKEYTEKQWGRNCRDLPSFIIRRLPVRFTFDNNYFDDRYQGIPISEIYQGVMGGGYNKIIDGLLQGVEVQLGVDFFGDREGYAGLADTIVFTGRIDEFFGYEYGRLAYRSVRFEVEELEIQNFQGNAVVNFTSHEQPYTRIIEHKHFEPESPAYWESQTVISREYSVEWKEGAEPFYPVNDKDNMILYNRYQLLASRERHVIFGGRLGEFKYYDMDDVIEKAMRDARRYLYG